MFNLRYEKGVRNTTNVQIPSSNPYAYLSDTVRASNRSTNVNISISPKMTTSQTPSSRVVRTLCPQPGNQNSSIPAKKHFNDEFEFFLENDDYLEDQITNHLNECELDTNEDDSDLSSSVDSVKRFMPLKQNQNAQQQQQQQQQQQVNSDSKLVNNLNGKPRVLNQQSLTNPTIATIFPDNINGSNNNQYQTGPSLINNSSGFKPMQLLNSLVSVVVGPAVAAMSMISTGAISQINTNPRFTASNSNQTIKTNQANFSIPKNVSSGSISNSLSTGFNSDISVIKLPKNMSEPDFENRIGDGQHQRGPNKSKNNYPNRKYKNNWNGNGKNGSVKASGMNSFSNNSSNSNFNNSNGRYYSGLNNNPGGSVSAPNSNRNSVIMTDYQLPINPTFNANNSNKSKIKQFNSSSSSTGSQYRKK